MEGSPSDLGREDYVRFVERGFDAAPQGYLLLDPDGTVLAANATAAAMLGLSRPIPEGTRIGEAFAVFHDFRGQPIPTEDRPSARVFATEEVVRETLVAAGHGHEAPTMWIEVTATPLFDASGRIWGALEVLVDATERLEAERRLHRLASIVEATDHGAVVTDLDRRIEWVNPAFTRMTGYTLDEVAGKKPGDLLQCDDTDPETVVRMRASLDTSEGFHEEVLNRDRQGRRRWIDLEVQPLLNHLGEHTHWMGLKRDITDRRTVETELRRMTRRAEAQTRALEIALERADALAHEARTADRAKNDFLRTASHALHAPLSRTLLAVSRLHDLVEDSSTRELADTALASCTRLLDLIDDVLAFASLAGGEIQPARSDLSVGGLLRDLERWYREDARTRGITFDVTSTPTALPWVRGDAGRVWQVLSILLDNAFARVDEGAVRLDLVANRGDRGWTLRFRVLDSGPTIGRDERDHLFVPLLPTDGAAREEGPSLGLGLAIARRMAGCLGGELGVVDDRSGATCLEFVLTLPEARPADEPSVASVGELALASGYVPKVLLAVDDGPMRPFLSRALRMFGARVDRIDDATTIPDAWIGAHHDLLLLTGAIDDDVRDRLVARFEANSKPVVVLAPQNAFDLAALGRALNDAIRARA